MEIDAGAAAGNERQALIHRLGPAGHIVISGLVVEKIPFTILNVALYLYLFLFLTISGSFSIKLGFLSDHGALLALIAIGAILLVVLLARVGVTQAMNSAALSGSASVEEATAYSIGQQLIVSAWDVLFAIVLVCWVFGWSGGKQLVESSYAEAKVKSRELKESRKQRKR